MSWRRPGGQSISRGYRRAARTSWSPPQGCHSLMPLDERLACNRVGVINFMCRRLRCSRYTLYTVLQTNISSSCSVVGCQCGGGWGGDTIGGATLLELVLPLSPSPLALVLSLLRSLRCSLALSFSHLDLALASSLALSSCSLPRSLALSLSIHTIYIYRRCRANTGSTGRPLSLTPLSTLIAIILRG